MSWDERADLGPLPEVDNNAVVQERSNQAISALPLIEAGLLLRLGLPKDRGVDGSLEVVAQKAATNYLAQMQIKGVVRVKPNRDGSVSHDIDVSNLNYLLNSGPSAIYVLYDGTSGVLWYAWAVDEATRLNATTPQWMHQETVAVRFTTPLNAAAFPAIRDRIARQSHTSREINDRIAHAALSESVTLRVTGAQGHVTSDAEAVTRLTASGMLMVSAGRWREAMDLLAIVPADKQGDAKLNLVRGYAYYAQGKSQTAFGFLGDAQLHRADLTKTDQDVLSVIRDACEFKMGRISLDDYNDRQAAAARQPGASAATRFESVRFSCLRERDRARRAAILQDARGLAAELIEDPSTSEAFRLQTRVQLAYLEGAERQMALLRSAAILCLQRRLAQTWAMPEPHSALRAVADVLRWWQEIRTLVDDARRMEIPWLHAEARRTAVVVWTAVIGHQRFLRRVFDQDVGPTAMEAKANLEEAFEVVACFEKAGDIHGRLRAQLALADLYEAAGDVAAAIRVATEVKATASAIGLGDCEQLANEHISRTTPMAELEAEAARRAAEDPDYSASEQGEADLDGMAEIMFATTQLPADRLPFLRKDLEAHRLGAIERLRWCKHLQLVQDLRHARHPSTAYASDTRWVGRCQEHGYESLEDTPIPTLTVDKFKRDFCRNCPDKDPKRARG